MAKHIKPVVVQLANEKWALGHEKAGWYDFSCQQFWSEMYPESQVASKEIAESAIPTALASFGVTKAEYEQHYK
jgi:hypothetical protein